MYVSNWDIATVPRSHNAPQHAQTQTPPGSLWYVLSPAIILDQDSDWRISVRTVLATIILLAVSNISQAQHLVEKTSPHDVKTTIARIVDEVQRAGSGVLGRIDHAGIAAGADLPLRPNVVIIFGNPKLGTPLMQSNPRIGLELPLRISAYQDEDGHTKIVYANFRSLAEIYGVTDENSVATVMDALDRITNGAISDATNAVINE